MAQTDTTRLDLSTREPGSSRATRRLRREGSVPGVLYGRDEAPLSFSVDALELRRALLGSGAVLEVALDGTTTPAVVKDTHRHPVRGDILHLDLLRVDLNQPIQATVVVEVTGVEEAPGTIEGGILEQVTREVTIEALPSDIPESITFDASGLEMNATVLLTELVAPAGVTIIDASEDITLVTITPPSVAPEGEEGDEVETETEVVGEGGEAAAEDEGSADADASGDDAE
jgi:large subunit ribosomal protein L25